MKPIQINTTITNNNNNNNNNNNSNEDRPKMLTTNNNNNSKAITKTIKTPVLWAVGLVVYIYFILFQILSSGLSSMGYNTIPLNDRFLNKRVIRLIPNRLKRYNNIPISYNNDNSFSSGDKRSYNTIKGGYHYNKNFIVFVSISNNDKEPQTIFNRFKPIFENHQIGLTVFETENKSDTHRLSYRIQQTEFDGIICVGDDNLVHDVVNCILNKHDYSINRHIPIGIIPVGKKNGFSNSLGIKSPEIAIKKIIQGNVNYIDIMSVSPVRNTTQLSFPKSNEINFNNSYNNNYIDIYNTNNNNPNGINYNNNNNNNNKAININMNQNNIGNNYSNNFFYKEYKVYSILYIGWGAISFRDSFKPWNSSVKPWLLSTFYSKFSKFSFNNFSSSLYFLPSTHFTNNQITKTNYSNNNNLENKNNRNVSNNKQENYDTQDHILYCSKKNLCEGCKKQHIDYDSQGKRSSKDFSDWRVVEGLNDSENKSNYNNENHSTGMSFFLAGNLSNISKDFKPFPFAHLSDGFLDLLISYQDDKKKLNQLIYDTNPSINCLTNDSNEDQQSNNNMNNNNKTTYYYKTKEFIFNVKNEDIPLSIDGELYNIKEFGSTTIKVQSHRELCAIFS
ncbi:hypothetical protein DICPUDRAFT_44072 [Dictyostelium purpureum]|uniref:DAGKc domain-containing protein n=1 Tax=Dictyostelium purpureum TaxID=5786 RepID=F1A5D8_DICPU|nr:uncharacterized protein DICPUDRAFT_44072 [Dictyostelium purpureum]EGC28592.1 hypothetical protein DICPUDRAFT_44072 [Dictyostelium purpureum]|eukprot:XP_003294881.1 hypothetical protein DICPUDRAFT_44072 [Dictyostelium purpureum]